MALELKDLLKLYGLSEDKIAQITEIANGEETTAVEEKSKDKELEVEHKVETVAEEGKDPEEVQKVEIKETTQVDDVKEAEEVKEEIESGAKEIGTEEVEQKEETATEPKEEVKEEVKTEDKTEDNGEVKEEVVTKEVEETAEEKETTESVIKGLADRLNAMEQTIQGYAETFEKINGLNEKYTKDLGLTSVGNPQKNRDYSNMTADEILRNIKGD